MFLTSQLGPKIPHKIHFSVESLANIFHIAMTIHPLTVTLPAWKTLPVTLVAPSALKNNGLLNKRQHFKK